MNAPHDAPSLHLAELEGPLHRGALDLRYRVLRAPLGMPPGSERYGAEDACLHFVAVAAGLVVGCVVFHPQSETGGRLLQMAVDPAWQGRGVGRLLVEELEREVGRRGFRSVLLHARQGAIGFYERLGYECEGEPYVEVGIPHRTMIKALPAT
jgi:ribosomal protein S18 acetylase RimI-like enzyme